MRTKAQTGTKDSKEKAAGASSSRSRNRGYGDSEDDVEIRDYDDATNLNETDVPIEHVGRKKYGRRKGLKNLLSF